MTVQSHAFRAETHKVLNILTHSLYTNREIFLRELLSNASDALDKLRYLQSSGTAMRHGDLPLEIRVKADKDQNILIIRDSGIGMTAAEMEENLGTIAKSGSEQFLKDIEPKKSAETESPESSDSAESPDSPDSVTEEEKIVEHEGAPSDASQIIGRFGIGFYSVFMVADKVEVISVSALESADSTAHIWTSDGADSFTLGEADEALVKELELHRGTVIRAYIKDNAKEFLEEFRLESIIRGHSNFLPFPIYLNDKQINTTPALWREPKFAITREQYNEFYTFLTYDKTAPRDVIHLAVDAPVQFNALLFIPETSQDYFNEQRDEWGPDLYVRRVLIERNRKELLPNYFAFIKGVVDTEDLPLNISRETLQENIVLRKISQTLVRQIMTYLERMASSDKEKYNGFWKLHGRYFKFAVNDYTYRDRVMPLLRFNSSHDTGESEELVSLDDYLSRAKSGQKEIWYVTAPSREAARLNPHMERFRRKGLEVLFLYDAMDEIALESLMNYKEFTFKSVEQADSKALDEFADTEDKKADLPELNADEQTDFDGMLAAMRTVLGDQVTDVRKTDRLSGSAACLSSPDGMSSSMEKLMRYMNKDKENEIPKKVLEVNPDHPLLRSLLRMYKDSSAAGSDAEALKTSLFGDMVSSLFESVLLLDGYLRDPYRMAERNIKLMEKAGEWYADLRKA